MSDNDTVIKLDQVSKIYKLYMKKPDRLKESLHPFRKKYHKEFYALNTVDLEVRRGEILGIIGRNGSGKSTMLRLIARITSPSSGNITVTGNVIPLLELGMGFNPDFTGLENAYFYSSIMGIPRKVMDTKIDAIIDFAEIGDYIHQPLKRYSSGMRARLAFAVSVNIDPDILILDEILSVGDELFRRKSYAKIEEFFKSGKTILFVSHSLTSINQLCQRTIMLDCGEKLIDGPSKIVCAQYYRFLMSEDSQKPKIREELLAMNREINSAGICELQEYVKKYGVPEGQVLDDDFGIKALSSATYMPNLITKSAIHIRNADIDLSDISIFNLDGKNVNSLVIDEEYLISFRASFNADVGEALFGIQVQTTKSLLIDEITLPGTVKSRKRIRNIRQGERFEVVSALKCTLLPGTYFINIFVVGSTESFQGHLVQITDAMVFKVQQKNVIAHSGIARILENARFNKLE
jgi:lipopolysaccharide transport system ATP-binding protein